MRQGRRLLKISVATDDGIRHVYLMRNSPVLASFVLLSVGLSALASSGARAAGLNGGAAQAYQDKSAAQVEVLAGLAPGDVVLVKASSGLALDTVAEAILAFGEGPA